MRSIQWMAGVGALALVAAAATMLMGGAAVFAHAGYERSEPGRNEVLPSPPDQVDVWFTQDVRKREGFYFARVLDEQGAQVSDGDGIVDDDDRSHIFTELPPGLPPGRYTVEWMTTSDVDGDDDEGAFCFYVGVEPTEEQAAACALFDDGPATQTTPGAQPTEPADSPTATAIPPDIGADNDNGGGFPVAAIIGIIAGVIVVLGAGVGGVWMRRR